MLKLKTSNGKFDIVFESDPIVDDKAKLSSIRATSAGRRKNLEWKSKILPKKNAKEINFNKVKTSKATQLRNERLATKYDRGKKVKNSPKESAKQDDSVVKNGGKITSETTADQHHTPPVTAEGKNIKRRDTYTYSADSTTGVISKEDFDAINKRLKKDDTVEPLAIPGLTSDTSKETSPNTTLESARQDAIRKKQSTPFEVYDPWGKPGAGAPMKSVDGGVRTHRNVKLIQHEKDKGGKNEHKGDQRKPPPKTTSEGSPRDVENKSSPKNTNTGVGSRYVRGQGKQQHELEDLEKKRQKHLEHQQAIAAQVEEKLLQKQLEKERKRREEEEEEARYQKQQDQIQQRLEEEQRKEREKREAKMLKQKMLEEGIRKAEEEARKAKEEARKARRKQSEPKPSSDFSAMSPKYRRVLHGDNDAIRPSNNFDDELADIKPNNHNVSDGTFRKPVKEETDTPKEIPRKESKIPKPKGKKKQVIKEKKDLYNYKPSLEDIQKDVLDDYLVPFHRTKTANMYETRGSSEDEEDEEEEEVHKAESEVQRFLNKKKDNQIHTNSKKKTKYETSDDEKEEEIHEKPRTKAKPKKEKKGKEPFPIHAISDISDDEEDEHETFKQTIKKKKAKEPSPRRSMDNELENTSNPSKYMKKPATSPQVNTKGTRISPRRNAQKSERPSESPSTKRQQEILNRLAELRAGLQQKERECYNTTWSR